MLRRVRWWRHYLLWRLRIAMPASQTPREGPAVTAIVLNYLRPGNIDPIVRGLLRVGRLQRIVVLNNSPERPLAPRLRVRDPRLELLDQPPPWLTTRRPGSRFELARKDPNSIFLAVDDDRFLYPSQADRLLRELLKTPEVPHGLFGQSDDLQGDPQRGRRRLRILNQIYAFTRQHVERYFELIEAVAGNQLECGDDIVLSFSGPARPWAHDFGPVLKCPTSNQPGVAVQTRPDFRKLRAQLVSQLRKHTLCDGAPGGADEL